MDAKQAWAARTQQELSDAHPHDAGDISGVFTSVTVIGDLWSTNWNGGVPVNLASGPIGAATAGFYLDTSAGAMQVMSLYAEGGQISNMEISNLDITGTISIESGGSIVDSGGNLSITAAGDITITGTLSASDVVLSGGEMGGSVEGDLKITGVLDLDDTGRIITQAGSNVAKVELTTSSADRIVFWSGLEAAAEDAPAYIRSYDSNDHPALAIVSATEDTDTLNYFIMQSAGTAFILAGTGSGSGSKFFTIEDYGYFRFIIDGDTHISWGETTATLAADTSIAISTGSLTLTGSTSAKLTDGTRYVEVTSSGTSISGTADVTSSLTADTVEADAWVKANTYVAAVTFVSSQQSGGSSNCSIRVNGRAGMGMWEAAGQRLGIGGTATNGVRILSLERITSTSGYLPVYYETTYGTLVYYEP